MSYQTNREQPPAGNGETHKQDSPEPPKETTSTSVDDIVQPLDPKLLKEVVGFDAQPNKK
jgi:hypothetical protein